ncbi:MAG: P1 family peptidase [Bacteroidota bacterium]
MRFLCYLLFFFPTLIFSQNRPFEQGLEIGVLPKGSHNAITDVAGLKVGQVSLHRGDSVHTGVTAILPHGDNLFQEKVPAAIYLGNAFGKLAGYTQVQELGNLETPVILTNTLSVPTAADALLDYTLSQPENQNVRSVNPVVGETNDGFLNDIRSRWVEKKHVLEAIALADTGAVAEGNVGAGTGTICFGFKGGIGTASRKLPASLGGYTVGVLVQTNFGGVLEIAGVPVGKKLGKYYFQRQLEGAADGSCMIVVATDAPLDARNLKRLAKRALLGLGKTGGIMSNGSGDYVIAFSTDPALRIPYQSREPLRSGQVLRNDHMSALFLGVIEATEEAVINSLFAAETVKGHRGTIEALPKEQVWEWLKE